MSGDVTGALLTKICTVHALVYMKYRKTLGRDYNKAERRRSNE